MTSVDLLAAVLAAPDDDAPRLVYADWLLERGDPRGELITVQCELAKLGHDARTFEADALRAREGALLKRHEKTWIGELPGARFARGFVDRVEMLVDDFVREAAALFAREPVRTYHPTNGSLATLLASCGELHRLVELDLDPWRFRGTDLVALARDEKMTALRSLVMSNCRLDAAAAIAFAEAAVPKPALRSLDLSWNHVGDRGVAALLGSPIVDGLTVLDLSIDGITAAGARAIAASPRLAKLERLRMVSNDLDDASRGLLVERFGARVVL